MSGPHIITFRVSEEEYAALEQISKAFPVLSGMEPPSCNIVARSLVLEALTAKREGNHDKKKGAL